jgi:hypothetical protein
MKGQALEEPVIFKLPPTSENIIFTYQAFGIAQHVLNDKRFPVQDVFPESFAKRYYDKFREKCQEIYNGHELSFTVDEFIFFAKIIDFVSKCFIDKTTNLQLQQVLKDDFKNDPGFKYNVYRKVFLKKAKKLFDDFRKNCTNKDSLERIKTALKWEI